jgi:hypothetical protein
LYLKRSWSDFDPQAYYLYGEDQNHETSFKDKALQAAVDSWRKIQVITLLQPAIRNPYAFCLSTISLMLGIPDRSDRSPNIWYTALASAFHL